MKCVCGHELVAHQTGQGPWTGFCGGRGCDCEAPVPESEITPTSTFIVSYTLMFSYETDAKTEGDAKDLVEPKWLGFYEMLKVIEKTAPGWSMSARFDDDPEVSQVW
jgi:hypothetical protein